MEENTSTPYAQENTERNSGEWGVGTFADTDECAYWAMRRDTGQLSLNFMTMIHAAAGTSVYVLSTKTGHRETENKLYTKHLTQFVLLSVWLRYKSLWLTGTFN